MENWEMESLCTRKIGLIKDLKIPIAQKNLYEGWKFDKKIKGRDR
jgi:hypothetical protein